LQIRALASTTAVDKATVTDPEAARLLREFEAAGLEVQVKVASLEDGCVNLYVVGMSRDDSDDDAGASALLALAGGEASHPVAAVALRKALLEWAAARARIAFMHGSLSEVERFAPPAYVARLRQDFSSDGHEPRALAAMKRWAKLPATEVRREMERVLRVDKLVPFGELPTAPEALNDDKIALAGAVAQRLQAQGMGILIADFSEAAGLKGVSALKVIVPGLEVETLSYGRIGARNLRRLMARDDIRLAGVGRAPEGAKRVWLTDEAEQTVGGPAWFDPRVQEEIVGPLYCLYREPGRHAVTLSSERDGL